MTKDEIFEAWAPPGAIWSQWVKPVLFSQMDGMSVDAIFPADPLIDLGWIVDKHGTTAIVIDLPGQQGLSVGLSLAAAGFRPVPLFNACPEPPGDRALVNIRPIMNTLAAAAPMLSSLRLPAGAPPVFMLDAYRNIPMAIAVPGMFDNRSISLPTDFPSGNLLLSRGIQRVVLIQSHGGECQADLSHTLRRWQESGLAILAIRIDEPMAPTPITIRRPNGFRLIWYNFLAKLGFISNPLGGFGGRLPMPSSG